MLLRGHLTLSDEVVASFVGRNTPALLVDDIFGPGEVGDRCLALLRTESERGLGPADLGPEPPFQRKRLLSFPGEIVVERASTPRIRLDHFPRVQIEPPEAKVRSRVHSERLS